jgi:hypothetical protein
MGLKDLKKGDKVRIATKWGMEARSYPELIAVEEGTVDSVRPTGEKKYSVFTADGGRFDATIYDDTACRVGAESNNVYGFPSYLFCKGVRVRDGVIADPRFGYDYIMLLRQCVRILDGLLEKGRKLPKGKMRSMLKDLVDLEEYLDGLE